MVQVLQPLEVRSDVGTQVCEQVWDDDDASLLENLIRSVGGGTVGSLDDHIALQIIRIMHVQRTVRGAGSENMVLFREELGLIFVHLLS